MQDISSLIGLQTMLDVKRKSEFGYYLGEDDLEGEVLLPNIYANELDEKDIKVSVFIYTDSEDRLVATTLKPLILLDEIKALKVKDHVENGIFLDMGLAKDLFMPTKYPSNYPLDSKVVVTLQKDHSNRLIAKKDISISLKPCKDISFLSKDLDALVVSKSDLGYSCVIGNYQGMLYSNEVFCEIKLGEVYKVGVKNIRSDGKLDLIIRSNKSALKEKILSILESKTTPYIFEKETAMALGVSFKELKRTLSTLVNENKISFIKDKGYVKSPKS
ncbi:S1-like domain-containing RNA-binding protein [Helicobacter sp. 11S02629-2]|uniref:S1-like domain-containing RNA-binding protein n=1 Tax=Helicobacter sp. 11S02629-2 TaxID=1476195 RepID=UPI000BA7846F|nr:S1-like domain-containing RNA-binding protein [Helicobacter sp. 11S02629-2]PAF45593.1 hypothetical protein BKH40_01555 [Helicobacter sp. 11S02629-2]